MAHLKAMGDPFKRMLFATPIAGERWSQRRWSQPQHQSLIQLTERARVPRAQVFRAHPPHPRSFQLHFSGSALVTLAGCRTEFRGQPARFRSPAPVGNIASVVLLRQPWAAVATVGKFLRRPENETCAQVATGAGAPAPMPQRRALPLILTAEFSFEQFRRVPGNRACSPARQSEFNTEPTCTTCRTALSVLYGRRIINS